MPWNLLPLLRLESESVLIFHPIAVFTGIFSWFVYSGEPLMHSKLRVDPRYSTASQDDMDQEGLTQEAMSSAKAQGYADGQNHLQQMDNGRRE